jgi:RND family efflux transporter MFP subunit
MRKLVPLTIVVVLASVALFTRVPAVAEDAPVAPAALPAAPVEVAAATEHDFAPLQWVPGTVLSRHDARIASEIGGRVIRAAEVGTTVARGDEIARLDDEALRIRATQDAAAIRRITAQVAFAEQQLARLSQLTNRSSVAQTQLDQSQSERDVLRADLSRARADADETQRQLRAATVRAPFDGVVAERLAQAGERVAAGAALVRLVDVKSVEISAQAPATTVRALAAGTPVLLRDQGVERDAVVRAVVPVGDVGSRQFEVRVALEGGTLPVGSAIEVGLPSGDERRAIAVPRDALILRAGESYVYRVAPDNKAQRVSVRTGTAQGEWVEVATGIAAGDRLVVRGGERLSEGQALSIAGDG